MATSDWTAEAFESRVRALQAEAEAHPGAYKLKVGLAAALGYGYITGVLLLLVGGIAGIVYTAVATDLGARSALIKAVWALGGLGYVVGQALWVRIPPPEGMPITRREAPELFLLIDEVRKRIKGPRAHAVMINSELNAFVAQRPRLGVFGWQKNYLVIGLPFLAATTPAEFTAVLAHEYGHISNAHGKFGSWIYRMQTSWDNLTTALEEKDHWGTLIFSRFFSWYSPFFNAYSFVLRRAHEYEADAASVQVAGSRAAADALVRGYVADGLLEECFWPEVQARVTEQPEPLEDVYGAQMRLLKAGAQADDMQRWLHGALEQETGTADSHPCLRDRLSALGETPRELGPLSESAAERFLANSLDSLSQALGREWQDWCRERWHDGYGKAEGDRNRLRELTSRMDAGENLSVDEAFEHADLTEDHEGAEEALPHFEAVAARAPEHAAARFSYGRLLLARGEEAGLKELDAAMDLTSNAIEPGCRLAYRFLADRDRSEEASLYRERFEAHTHLMNEAQEERDSIGEISKLVPHSLDQDVLDCVCERLREYPRVTEAFVLEKPMKRFPDDRLYFVVVTAKFSAVSRDPLKNDPEKYQALLSEELRLPFSYFVRVLPYRKKNRLAMRETYGEPVYTTV